MADVSGDDRGQLVLVTALAMATLFVVLALLVNTTIYTGNVATRSDVSESTAVVNYRTGALDAVETMLWHVNGNGNDSEDGSPAAVNTTYARLNDSLRSGVGNWSDDAAAHDAVSGTATRTSVVGVTNGTRVAQTNASRNLSSPSGTTEWTPVTNATGIRDLRFTLDSASLASVSDGENVSESELLANETFQANLTDAAGTRLLFVYGFFDGAGVAVRGSDGGLTTCDPVVGGNVTVDVEGATVGGEPCPALSAFDESSGSFNLSFDGGGNAVGTYSFIVDREVNDTAVNQSLSLDSGAPFRTAALYNATVRVVYHGPDTYYEAETEVPDATA